MYVAAQAVARPTPAAGGPSVVMGGGISLEISGYPRPDTDQMIPFKPKLNTSASYHPVPGGNFCNFCIYSLFKFCLRMAIAL